MDNTKKKELLYKPIKIIALREKIDKKLNAKINKKQNEEDSFYTKLSSIFK